MSRVGAIDCGTNSIRLLIAEAGDGGLTDLVRRMEIVRLGQGVDVNHRFDPAAIERTLSRAREYASQCEQLGVSRVRFVATSASRDASNAEDFLGGVRDAFSQWGVEPEVISGGEEAGLSFIGATGDVRASGAAAPYLVIDLGGGSTEFVRGTDAVETARSVNIGCVRMTERHLRSDPPTQAELTAASADIEAAIDAAIADVPLAGVASLVGLAGTVTTITAHALGLTEYDEKRLHGARLSVAETVAACDALIQATRSERAAMGFMHEGRVDVIGAGALIWKLIVQRVADVAGISTVITSEKDILDGIALSISSSDT